jgi:alpha,alpha-trehalase
MNRLLKELGTELDKLRPQSIRPAHGYIRHDYLIPGGFYQQMWDWDGFFIGLHLAIRQKEDAKYLKWWVLNFALSIDEEGYVPGCITPKGPRPVFGKFAMKPFLAQGAYLASRCLGDFDWLAPVYESVKKVLAYREKTQFDPKYGLFFWESAGQSGADNNPVLSNDPHDSCAILAADVNAFQFGEYKAMSRIAAALRKEDDARCCTAKAEALGAAMLKYLWFPADRSFFNIRRDNGLPIKRVSYSNFVPLMEDLLRREEAAVRNPIAFEAG